MKMIVAVVLCVFAGEAAALDWNSFRVAERTCTLNVTKVKKDKKDKVIHIYGYRRTDPKKKKFEIDVNVKKMDKESKNILENAAKGSKLRAVYAWSFTGRYLVKIREFTEKQQQQEDAKIAAGEVEESDDADNDDDEGEKAAGKKVTDGATESEPKEVEDEEMDEADMEE